MKKPIACLLLHLLASLAHSQVVTLPAEIKGAKGSWIIVAPLVDGGAPKWRIDPGLQEVDLGGLLPADFVSKLKGRVFTSEVAGRFKIEVWCAKADVASDIAFTYVVVGGGIPDPPTPPIPPTPPGPTPSPSPFPGDGLRVFILWDDKGAKLPEDQQDIIFNPDVRNYLEAKCPVGPDGKTREYRMWPLKDGKVDGFPPKMWADAMTFGAEVPLPKIIVGNGRGAYKGPLPKNKDEAMTLFKQFGG